MPKKSNFIIENFYFYLTLAQRPVSPIYRVAQNRLRGLKWLKNIHFGDFGKKFFASIL